MSGETKRREPQRYSPAMISSTASPERRFVDEGDYDALARECEELRAAMQLEGCMVTMRYHNKHMTALEAERDRLQAERVTVEQAQTQMHEERMALHAERNRLRERVEELEAAHVRYGDDGAVRALRDANDRAERAKAKLQTLYANAVPGCDCLNCQIIRRDALADEEPSERPTLPEGLSPVADADAYGEEPSDGK